MQHLDFIATTAGHPIEIGADGDVAVLIGTPLKHLVGRWQMRRQLHQKAPFMLEGFGGNESALALGAVFQAIGGPRQGLLVEVLQVLKAAAGQKVRLHRPKTSLLARLAIGMLEFVAVKLEAVLLAEGRHLRDDEGVAPATPQPRQVGVVDDALTGGVAPPAQGLMKKALHLEAVETAVELQVASLRVAQVEQTGDELDPLATQLDLIDAGVLLHL